MITKTIFILGFCVTLIVTTSAFVNYNQYTNNPKAFNPIPVNTYVGQQDYQYGNAQYGGYPGYNTNNNNQGRQGGYNTGALASPVLNAPKIPQTQQQQQQQQNSSGVLGTVARPGQFAFQASVELNGRHYCGGTILAPIVVITAAHCVYQQSTMGLSVFAGTVDLQRGGIRSHVDIYKIHPGYNPSTKDFDIAIIFLKAPLSFSSYVQPAVLPPQNQVIQANAVGTISGWGTEGGNGKITRTLKYVHYPLLEHNVCRRNFPFVTNTMICVGLLNGQRVACPGDSGGPLTLGNMLIGVLSWGYGCNVYGKPTVFSYVGGVRQWISDTARV